VSKSPHELRNPEGLAPAKGYTHAVIAAPGRTVYLGGQTAHGPDGTLSGRGTVEQFDAAAANVAMALEAVGALPEHLVSMLIFVTDAAEYRASLKGIGVAWRRHLGDHYPAVSLFEVSSLLDPEAKVELVGTAVVPT
jgi:enamine deaminase RidA (YjgF/YER057c/UK114 family)